MLGCTFWDTSVLVLVTFYTTARVYYNTTRGNYTSNSVIILVIVCNILVLVCHRNGGCDGGSVRTQLCLLAYGVNVAWHGHLK